MLLKPLTVAAAGLAVSCAAFLLPPEISEADVAITDALSFKSPEIAQSQSISLDCPGCPVLFKNKHGHIKINNNRPNHLELSFNVDHQSGSDRLLLNGFELYPNSDPFHNVLTVPQVLNKKEGLDTEPELKVKDKHRKKGRHHPKEIVPPQLGFSLQIHPAAEDKDGQQFKMIALDLQIIEVGSRFVGGIPNVHIKLIQDSNGNLMIGNIETTSSQSTPMEKQEECITLMCKWLTVMKDKLSHVKGSGCHGKTGMMGQAQGSEAERKYHGGRPHRFDRNHYHHRSWAQLFRNITSHILLPILIGIIAGVSVSLIGMVVGTILVALWRTFFRRPRHRRAGHAHHKAVQKEAAVAEEKSGLMQHQDPPPTYEVEDRNAKQLDV